MRKRSIEKLLQDTAIELVEGEALLAEKKKARKKAKSKLARKNAARSEEIIEAAVESIEDHRELLKRAAVVQKPLGKKSIRDRV